MNRRTAKALLAVWERRRAHRRHRWEAAKPGTKRAADRYARYVVAVHKTRSLHKWLAEHPAPVSTRKLVMGWMKWALLNNNQIHYLQRRPMRLPEMRARMLPLSIDCSESTTGAYYAAGALDPNGNKYDGTGYTGTIRAHLPTRAHVALCRIGDPIVYGEGTGSHVVMVFKAGRDPLVFSHGQEAGPLLNRHSVQLATHGAYYTAHNGGLK